MLDKYFGRQWSKDYTCHNLASEVWQDLTGKVLEVGNYEQLGAPQSPCIVFMTNNHRKDSHVGIFVDGRVIHLSIRGTQWIPLEYLQMQFKEVSFYK